MAVEMIVLKTFEYNMFPQVKKIKYPVSGIGKNCDPGIFYVIFFCMHHQKHADHCKYLKRQ